MAHRRMAIRRRGGTMQSRSLSRAAAAAPEQPDETEKKDLIIYDQIHFSL